MDLKNVQDNFENLLSNVPSDCLADFFGWIQRKYLVAGKLNIAIHYYFVWLFIY